MLDVKDSPFVFCLKLLVNVSGYVEYMFSSCAL